MKTSILLTSLCLMNLLVLTQPRLPENYYWQRLENGLEVVVIENNKVPLATIKIAVKNGAYTEGDEYSGLSHLYEHMFFKANRDYPDQEKFLRRIDELGAIFNGTTGTEHVNYFFTFNKDSLDAGLQFMNSAIRFPIYRDEDMKKERPVVDGEFQRLESTPTSVLYLEGQKKLWGKLVSRKNPIGDHNVINTATPEKMKIIKDKYYYPNNSLLIICGDVKHEQAFALAKKIYGDWQRSDFDPIVKFPIPEFEPLKSVEYFVKESTIAQTPYIFLFWQGPDTRNDSTGTLAADVFSTILALNSSKWQQALIDKGLASDVGMTYSTSKYVGPILANVTPNPDKIKECYETLTDQIKAWSDDAYFTDEQLADAREVLRRQQLRSKEKPSSLPHDVTYHWASTSLDYMTDYEKNLTAITRADIKKYIATYITGKPYVAGMIINPEMNKAANTASFFKPALQ